MKFGIMEFKGLIVNGELEVIVKDSYFLIWLTGERHTERLLEYRMGILSLILRQFLFLDCMLQVY